MYEGVLILEFLPTLIIAGHEVFETSSEVTGIRVLSKSLKKLIKRNFFQVTSKFFRQLFHAVRPSILRFEYLCCVIWQTFTPWLVGMVNPTSETFVKRRITSALCCAHGFFALWIQIQYSSLFVLLYKCSINACTYEIGCIIDPWEMEFELIFSTTTKLATEASAVKKM